jgi:hypothetical protein
MSNIGEIAIIFLTVRNQLKLYHWKSLSYSRHIAADKFVSNLDEKIDLFIEVIQGSKNKRLIIPNSKSINVQNYNDDNILNILSRFANWLTDPNGLPKYLKKTDLDLFNIRDEILANVNKTLYLFSLS